MIPLETLQHSMFVPLLDQNFSVRVGVTQVTLKLDTAKLLGHRRTDATRDPFSLTFRGPSGLRLPQGIYPFSCEALQTMDLFIAQIGDGPQGSEFEAVFT